MEENEEDEHKKMCEFVGGVKHQIVVKNSRFGKI